MPAAEILAAAESIDKARMISHAYNKLLGVRVHFQVCVDSKDLFTSLSTQRSFIDRSIRSDVAYIRYEFQLGNVDKITWLPDSLNLDDDLTKLDSPLTDVLQLTLYIGLQLDLGDVAETKTAEKNFG